MWAKYNERSNTLKKSQLKLDSTLFLDRTHGKAMATLLRRVGLKVKTIYQVYPKNRHQSIKDPQWIAKCGERGWVAISGDKRIARNVENKKAVVDAKCKLFLLTDTNSLPEEWASAIILGREKMSNVIHKNRGPFFATIAKRSDSHVSHAKFPDRTGTVAEEQVSMDVKEVKVETVAGIPPVIKAPENLRLFNDESGQKDHKL